MNGDKVPRYYTYFIVCHKKAECFNDFKAIIDNTNYKFYAYILHTNDINKNTGENVEPHYTLVLDLKNNCTFSAMQKRFKGAHIEICKFLSSSCAYMLHDTENSDHKYKYDISNVVSSDITNFEFLCSNKDKFRVFNEEEFLQYIYEGVNSEYRFIKEFGLTAHRNYWLTYCRLLILSNSDPEMKRDLEKLNNNDLPF